MEKIIKVLRAIGFGFASIILYPLLIPLMIVTHFDYCYIASKRYLKEYPEMIYFWVFVLVPFQITIGLVVDLTINYVLESIRYYRKRMHNISEYMNSLDDYWDGLLDYMYDYYD